jgi:ECF transporter S component (folate family)
MKKKLVLRICVSGMLAALAFVLNNYFAIDLFEMKLTLYALPLMICGMYFGPVAGLLCGGVTGFLCQLFSKYGLTVTAPLWMLAPMAWGFLSGVMMKLFKKDYKLWKVVVSVVIVSLIVVGFNSFAMIIDGIVFEYPTEYVLTKLGIRIFTALVNSVIYTALLYIVLNRLKRVVK